jgi:DNA-binding transcriptional ArsR family regulator
LTQRDILYSYWQEIPNVKLHKLPSKVMYSHEARGAILAILREGIKDTEGTRHAMKAEEIKTLLQEKHDIKMSQTNLYFHLGVLEENGVLQIVTRITEGRHNVAYYGRTSKAILIRDPAESLERYAGRFMEMSKLTKIKHPDFDLDKAQGLAEEYLKIKQGRDQALSMWVNEHEEQLREHEIDLAQVFEFLKTLDSVNPRYIEFLEKTKKIMKIEI